MCVVSSALLPAHERALQHVAAHSSGAPLDRSLRVTLNFHPDRTYRDGTVISSLVTDGVYRSQFETKASNGSLSSHPGGARWQWEQRLFGGAYDTATPEERPKYGGLNFRNRREGAAPRFGSAHLRMSEHVLDRSSFCFPDSVLEPNVVATAVAFDLWDMIADFDALERNDDIEATKGGYLDDYVEAHVHGVIEIARDAEAIVLDPSFRNSLVEEEASLLGIAVEWHEGRRLNVPTLLEHPNFRGTGIVEAGVRLAVDGYLDAAVLGNIAARSNEDPDVLKKLWHYVARFGEPIEPTS